MCMNAQDNDGRGVLWPALLGGLLLVVGLGVGLVVGRDIEQNITPDAPTATVVPTQEAAVSLTAEAINQAAATQEEDIVTFWFPSASAALGPEAQEALGAVVKGVAAGRKAVISGFDGVDGGLVPDQDLTRRRVQAVRDTLAARGIGDDKMELVQPAPAATGAGTARVEVRLE
jgi:outer membrane protein OmpA-like peptidoglycan-associated protein